MDPLVAVCEICAEKSRLPDRSTLSGPGTAGVYLGTQRVHKGCQQIDFRCVTRINIQSHLLIWWAHKDSSL
jgi:hypothetical protein